MVFAEVGIGGDFRRDAFPVGERRGGPQHPEQERVLQTLGATTTQHSGAQAIRPGELNRPVLVSSIQLIAARRRYEHRSKPGTAGEAGGV